MKDKLINWGIFILLSLIWGSSFKLMKVGMVSLSPYEVAALRMLSAGLVLLPFSISAIKKVPASGRSLIIVSGLLGSFFPAFLFCIAETRIDSSLAGILNALTPLFTIVVGVMFFNLQVSFMKYVGVLIGFTGLTLLFIAKGNIDITYISFSMLILIATLMYGLNVNLISKHLTGIGSLNIASLAFSFLIIPSGIILYFTGYFSKPLLQPHMLTATLASAVLGIFGTALASIIFYVLVKRAGGVFASMVTYGIPFVAVFWGLLSGETINLLQVGCLIIILTGVYMANRVKRIKNPA